MLNIQSKYNKLQPLKGTSNVSRETIKNPNPYKLLPKNWSSNLSQASITIHHEINGELLPFNLINQIKHMDYKTLLQTKEHYVKNQTLPYSNQSFYDAYCQNHRRNFNSPYKPVGY